MRNAAINVKHMFFEQLISNNTAAYMQAIYLSMQFYLRHISPFILDTNKQVSWQIVKTRMMNAT